ncbi:MAG: hypothetical protein IJT83_08730 [Victivallales bacterium]|nr:hypothetical protein [Victivallales bacterium]
MNNNHVQQIFAHYIDKFEYINNPTHQEYYKWQIAKRFRDAMDVALAAPAEEFPSKLYEVKKLTSNLIDSYTQPFHGLVKFAEREPETVRNMFKMLFSDDGGNIENRQERIQSFLSQSHALRDKYYPDSYLYKEDMHSVTGYLFLYDPDHNYIYKATHSRDFADCIEFYDDWGYGTDVKLSVYYRMCDQLVEAIKSSKELMATDASRFENGWGENPDTFHPDIEKHILAFDLIYCCSTYGLFNGISFEKPKTKERQLMQERKDKAKKLAHELKDAETAKQELDEALQYMSDAYCIGTTLHHKKYGVGTIKNVQNGTIIINFAEVGEKQLDLLTVAAYGIVTVDTVGYNKAMSRHSAILKQRNNIETKLSIAEKNFAQYASYL